MNSVEHDIKTLVGETVSTQFERLGLDPPVFAQFDVVSAQGKVLVSINLLTEQPVGVVRETRELVARALTSRGYRMEAATEPANAPEVRLTLMSSLPVADYLAGYNPAKLRDYLAVGGMAVSSLLLLLIAVLMFKRLRHGLRRRASAIVNPPRSVAPRVEPTFATFVGELPPLPGLDLGPGVAPIDQLLAAVPDADALTEPIDLTQLAKAPRATVRSAFSQLSLDTALELLAAVDPAISRVIIDKLQLHRSVQERLEEGLAALRLERQT